MKRLSEEDRHLWSRVAGSVKRTRGAKAFAQAPLPRVEPMPRPKVPPIPAPPPKPAARHAQPRPPASLPGPQPSGGPGRFDTKLLRRIARGRTPIDGRIDLHGMTRDDARARLLDFLALSRAAGRRTVLVITGKGTVKGKGVLRREVPLWLAMAPFAALVGAVDEARREHGGEGALYVRLRK